MIYTLENHIFSNILHIFLNNQCNCKLFLETENTCLENSFKVSNLTYKSLDYRISNYKTEEKHFKVKRKEGK